MADRALKSPEIIGRYAVFDRIAAGGMASVHVGRLFGKAGFARTVAIKRLHAQFAADADFVSAFVDEARLAARIRHPNVVATLDVVAAGPELVLVMDYVDGESLSVLIRTASGRTERVPPAVASGIICGVLHGLHAAHEAKSDSGEPLGIVHRDVSPQNVLIGLDGVPRVLDFGIAKALGQLHTTREGQMKGKIAYMAPEQIGGRGVTRRTDVFAVGAVLWELLTGQRLFRGDEPIETAQKVMLAHIDPPSVHVPGLAPVVDAVVLRALERDAGQRFATAEEMAVALEEALPPATPRKIGEWVRSISGDKLAARAKQVCDVESVSMVDSQVREAVSRPPPDQSEIAVDTATLNASSVSLLARRHGEGRWIAAGAVVLLVAGGAVGYRLLKGSSPPAAAPAASLVVAQSAGAPSAQPSATASTLPPPTGSIAATSIAVASSVVPSSVVPSSASAARPGAPGAPATARPARPAAPQKPAFYSRD